jgi:negative regulator of genetic competence, sporulation and motility
MGRGPHRNSEASALRVRLMRITEGPARQFGFTTRDFMIENGLEEYRARETFVKLINERIKELGYRKEGPMWVR